MSTLDPSPVWRALARFQSASRLTDAQLVERAVDLANGGDENIPVLLGRRPRRGEKTEAAVAEFRRRLIGIVEKPRRDKKGRGVWVVDGLAEALNEATNVIMRPAFAFSEDEELLTAWEIAPKDLASMLGYIFLLFLDISRPYGANLCQCQLPDCGRLFLAQKPETGRPRRKYCSTEHMSAAHQANSYERVLASRKARKRAKKKTRGAK